MERLLEEPLSREEIRAISERIAKIRLFLAKEHQFYPQQPITVILGAAQLESFCRQLPQNIKQKVLDQCSRGKSEYFALMDQNTGAKTGVCYFPEHKVRDAIFSVEDEDPFVEEVSHWLHGHYQLEKHGVADTEALFTEMVGVLDRFNYQYHNNALVSQNRRHITDKITAAKNNPNADPIYSLSHYWGNKLNAMMLELPPDQRTLIYEELFNSNDRTKLYKTITLFRNRNIPIFRTPKEKEYLRQMVKRLALEDVVKFA